MPGTRVEESKGVTIICLETAYGSLNTHALEEVERVLMHEASDTESQGLMLDMGKTVYFGCGFLRVLLRCLRQTREMHKRLALCQLRVLPGDVLKITCVDTLCEIFETRDEALEAMRKTTV